MAGNTTTSRQRHSEQGLRGTVNANLRVARGEMKRKTSTPFVAPLRVLEIKIPFECEIIMDPNGATHQRSKPAKTLVAVTNTEDLVRLATDPWDTATGTTAAGAMTPHV